MSILRAAHSNPRFALLARPRSGLILGPLGGGPLRSGELELRAHGLGSTTLSARLEELEGRGLITCSVEPGPQVRVSDELSAKGRGFEQVAQAIQRGGQARVDPASTRHRAKTRRRA